METFCRGDVLCGDVLSVRLDTTETNAAKMKVDTLLV
jgi:hypothetical protein